MRQGKSNFCFPGWTGVTIAIALIIAAPILFVFSSIGVDAGEIWAHLAQTVLPQYLMNSLWLMLGVGSGVLIIGVGTAWLVTMCRFWGSNGLQWALLLPMAAPAYLLAYTYTEILDYYGFVQRGLRSSFGWESIQDYWFPEIRSLPGAILMLVLVLYPYVYLLARAAFLEQSEYTLEASRSLGCSPWQSFFRVALPLARPGITAGLALVLMETLSDFGTVQYFGVVTFTTGIYRTWLGLGERVAAAQLAAVLMLLILVLIVLEYWSRRQSRYYQTSNPYQTLNTFQLTGMRGIFALIACCLPIFLGFVLPAGYLLHLTLRTANFDRDFLDLATHSFILAAITAGLGILIALVLAYSQRLNHSVSTRVAVRIAAMGYAIPGSVIAVGVLIPMGQFDNLLDGWMRSAFGISTGLLLSGTISALIYAYLVRFLAVAFGTIESSLGKIKPTLDEASRSLGYTPRHTLLKVHTPLMWGSLLSAAMLVFVDVMKELPETLVIRPFNFDTLAIQVYQYASDERLTEAAAPALGLIVVGMIPVIFLSLQIARRPPVQEIVEEVEAIDVRL
jgi:iron(III) transport system permease protein